MTIYKRLRTGLATGLLFFLHSFAIFGQQSSGNYVIVDTGQEAFYDNDTEVQMPGAGDAFHGQDAHYAGVNPSYQDNGDATITDLNTGLMWQKSPDLDNKSTYAEAVADAASFALAGHDDWRLPTLKELYSLILFTGSSQSETPYIDTDYFDFRFGDESLGERLIDGQYWSSTEYAGTTMNGDATVFGVNFADGRIKGYPAEPVGPPGSQFSMTAFVRYVRGNSSYGVNNFVDNGDGTVTDLATGLMWQKASSDIAMNWAEALDYAENLDLANHSDWRLPNAKELQSIVDYTRAPDATSPAQQGAAIDPIFDITETESWFWSSTTLLEAPVQMGGYGSHAVYVTFGQAFGWMEQPPNSGSYVRLNVHGAGAQRSDPKSGDAADWPTGFGPQGDEIRILNYARCVRTVDTSTGVGESDATPDALPGEFALAQNYPNPFNPSSTIEFVLEKRSSIKLRVFDILGKEVATLADGTLPAGSHKVVFEPTGLRSGVYFYQIAAGGFVQTKKLTLLR